MKNWIDLTNYGIKAVLTEFENAQGVKVERIFLLPRSGDIALINHISPVIKHFGGSVVESKSVGVLPIQALDQLDKMLAYLPSAKSVPFDEKLFSYNVIKREKTLDKPINKNDNHSVIETKQDESGEPNAQVNTTGYVQRNESEGVQREATAEQARGAGGLTDEPISGDDGRSSGELQEDASSGLRERLSDDLATGQSGSGLRSGVDLEDYVRVNEDLAQTLNLEKATRPNFGRLAEVLEPIHALDSGFKAKEKFNFNIEAIDVLIKLTQESTEPDEADLIALAKYVGWGGLDKAFSGDYSWTDQRKTLAQLVEDGHLTGDDYHGFERSTINAHYTQKSLIEAIWESIERAGFEKGKILEPSCGTGNFIGLAPAHIRDNSVIEAVELERVSATIAQTLYPQAKVHHTGFEKYSVENASIDLVIGNVPFGQYKLNDPKYNKHKLSIHNYFIVKSLDALRPEGMAALLTSTYTLDSQSSHARRLMARQADLVGAVRIPAKANQSNAGTEASMDLLIFKKLEKPRTEAEIDQLLWVNGDVSDLDEGSSFNPVFFNSDDNQAKGVVIGDIERVSTQFGYTQQATLKDMTQLPALLKDALDSIVQPNTYQANQLSLGKEDQAPIETVKPSISRVGIGMVIQNEGELFEISRILNDGMVEIEPYKVKKEQKDLVIGLVSMRETLLNLLEAQRMGDSESSQNLRSVLNEQYDQFVAQYGVINQDDIKALFKNDPLFYYLTSIEGQNFFTKEFEKAKVFFEDILTPYLVTDKANDALHALQLSLNHYGNINLNYMSRISGIEVESIIEQLNGTQMFLNPATMSFEPASQYLSGYVVDKLKTAEDIARNDERFLVNVKALRENQPEPVSIQDIYVNMGAPWIDVSYVEQFIREVIFEKKSNQPALTSAIDPESGGVSFKLPKNYKNKYAAYFNEQMTSTWGTGSRTALELISDLYANRSPEVTKTITLEDGKTKSVVDPMATSMAMQKAEAIKAEFDMWLWSDPERATALLGVYNSTFNNYKAENYDGSYLTFPGMNPAIKPRKHQVDAVARYLFNGNMGLFHEVGMGKTYVMGMCAMKSRELGLTKRNMIVVPNHMVNQLTNELRALYPGANIAAIEKDGMTKSKRREYLGGILMNAPDIAVISHSSFEMLGLSPEAQQQVIRDEVVRLKSFLREDVKGEDKRTIKQIEAKLARLEGKLSAKARTEEKDDTIYFDDFNIDGLLIDEAHLYKNLFIDSKIRGANQDGSNRAYDLYSKLKYIYQQRGSESGVVLATGTPVSNNMSEMYTLFRYLNPRGLEVRGIDHFDRYASQFFAPKSDVEVTVSGNFQTKTRLNPVNSVELSRMASSWMDYRRVDDTPEIAASINRPTPTFTEHVAKKTLAQEVFSIELTNRAMAIADRKVKPDQDNLLKLSSDGKKAAVDIRMIDPFIETSGDTKIDLAIDNVSNIYHQTMDSKAAQIIFCDIGTPNTEGFSVYREIKQGLIDKGVNPDEIAFVHDAESDDDREAMFSKVRNGDIRVLMGSTAKMGTGTNVQERLYALHHIDVPWRPSDLEQRNGRIIRQGNKFSDVQVHTYVTEGSFDQFMWQTVARKANEQVQLLRGQRRSSEEEIEMDYNSILAISTGSNLFKERSQLESELKRVLARQREYQDKNVKAAFKLKVETESVQNAQQDIKKIDLFLGLKAVDVDAPYRVMVKDEWVSMSKEGFRAFFKEAYKAHFEAQMKLNAGKSSYSSYSSNRVEDFEVDAFYMGVPTKHVISTTYFNNEFNTREAHTCYDSEDRSYYRSEKVDFYQLYRLENSIESLEARKAHALNRVETSTKSINRLKEQLEKPFAEKDAIIEMNNRLNEVNKLIDQELEAIKQKRLEAGIPETIQELITQQRAKGEKKSEKLAEPDQ